MRVLMIAPPGAGKGTQGALIAALGNQSDRPAQSPEAAAASGSSAIIAPSPGAVSAGAFRIGLAAEGAGSRTARSRRAGD